MVRQADVWNANCLHLKLLSLTALLLFSLPLCMSHSNLLLCMKTSPLDLDANCCSFLSGLASDYGLFLSDEDPRKGIWLESGRTMDYYMLRNGVKFLSDIAYDKSTPWNWARRALEAPQLLLELLPGSDPRWFAVYLFLSVSLRVFLFFREDSGTLNGFLSYKSTKANPR